VTLPIAVIGAGPVGLAAAAHCVERGLPFVLLEAGSAPAAAVRAWQHVQLFSPWQYCVDAAAVRLLTAAGWQAPPDDTFPTGAELIEHYLAPLAALPAIAGALQLDSRVTAVTRDGADRVLSRDRAARPFVLTITAADGSERRLLAAAVIDAGGTYQQPAPLGSGGVPALGERALRQHIFYGIPDLLGLDAARYRNRRVLVVGSGHSAFHALLDLVALNDGQPAGNLQWAVRRSAAAMVSVFGGGAADGLPERAALGTRVRRLVDSGRVTLVDDWQTTELHATPDGIVAVNAAAALAPVDEIIVCTGLRPDLAPLGELRLSLDAIVQAPAALAPLIDPNVHSCGSVPPHGVRELSHPDEPGMYIVGMKSYGRAPTFLLLTGYEQVRSVTAALAGDFAAAYDVQLVLPETGVCCGPAETACCTPEPVAACCTPEPVAACCTPEPVAACCTPEPVATPRFVTLIPLS
jgi:hypothetical protein